MVFFCVFFFSPFFSAGEESLFSFLIVRFQVAMTVQYDLLLWTFTVLKYSVLSFHVLIFSFSISVQFFAVEQITKIIFMKLLTKKKKN